VDLGQFDGAHDVLPGAGAGVEVGRGVGVGVWTIIEVVLSVASIQPPERYYSILL
jgi:hypothetical protein